MSPCDYSYVCNRFTLVALFRYFLSVLTNVNPYRELAFSGPCLRINFSLFTFHFLLSNTMKVFLIFLWIQITLSFLSEFSLNISCFISFVKGFENIPELTKAILLGCVNFAFTLVALILYFLFDLTYVNPYRVSWLLRVPDYVLPFHFNLHVQYDGIFFYLLVNTNNSTSLVGISQ